jgi:hypothetical protein
MLKHRKWLVGVAVGFAWLLSLAAVTTAETDAAKPYPGWKTYTSAHFVFYYAPDSSLSKPGAVERFASGREEALDAICKYLGVSPQKKITFYAYDNADTAMKLLGRNAGFAEPSKAIVHSQVNQTRGHEVAHVVTYWVNPAYLRVRLLSEGLAVYLDQSGRDYLKLGRRLLDEGGLPPIDQIMAQTQSGTGYQPAGAFVAYLCEVHGLDKFKRLWGVTPETLDQKFQTAYGKTLSQMEQDWHAYLRSSGASQTDREADPAKKAAAVEKARAAYAKRNEADSRKYTRAQLQDISRLYTLRQPEALKELIRKYPRSNRAGCATLDLATMSEGAERDQYLRTAIDKYGDCFYTDGVQVGAYARLLLGRSLNTQGDKEKADALFRQIKTRYPDAIGHKQELVTDLIP